MPSTISAGTTAGTAIAIAGDTTGNLAFQTNGTTTAMTINTSQQVGIGTTTPTANTQLDVVSANASQQYVDVLKLKTSFNGDFHPSILFENNRNGIANAVKLFMDSATTDGTGYLGFRIKNSGGTFVTVGGFASGGEFQMNSGYGSVATAYGCRVWVNFGAASGSPSIRASGNVSSITDNGTGDFTINFGSSLPNNNYSSVGTVGPSAGGSALNDTMLITSQSISSVRVLTYYGFSGSKFPNDYDINCVALFR